MEQDGFSRDEGRGRSARKRAAKQVEEHARRLTELSEADLRRLTLPAEIAAELNSARQTRGHSSKKRAVKHLAGLLRRDEECAAAVAEFLAGEDAGRYREAARFQSLEAWRDRLCARETSDEGLAELRRLCPELVDGAFERQVRAARNGDRSAARAVFRRLRDAGDRLVENGK
ncbi:MAG: ribosome biogenesis factor YjgA [Geothermobacteraceae bacterium]